MDEPLDRGVAAGLHFRLHWLADEGATVADRTRGELQAWLGDTLVWGAHESGDDVGIEWCWIELLEHLAVAWRYLEWEEGNPLGLHVLPHELRAEAEKRWRSLPSARRATEERALYEYAETHNLAAGLKGLYLPALWVVREGNGMRLVGGGRGLVRPVTETLRALEELGAAIFERAKPLKNDDARAQAALRAWSARRKVSLDAFIAVATGLSATAVDELVQQRSTAEWLGIQPEKPAANELLAAARMIGSTAPVSTVRTVIERVRRVPRRDTSRLDAFSRDFSKELAKLEGETPADQGTALARKLRSDLSLGTKPADPADVLERWAVQLVEVDLGVASIDAVACWGPKHGPVVLVNKKGQRAQREAGRRATLAHELCHLLVDRSGALPLGEVLGGNLPPLVEPRANAFAAEFLFPRSEAEQLATVPFGLLADAVRRMSRRYRVSQEIIAWQIRNSGSPLSDRHFAYLRGLVSDPDRF